MNGHLFIRGRVAVDKPDASIPAIFGDMAVPLLHARHG